MKSNLAPREIHYELVPNRYRGDREELSFCKLLLAAVIGVVIIAIIIIFMFMMFSTYIRPVDPPRYIIGDNIETIYSKTENRRPPPIGTYLEVIVVYHPDNGLRAEEVQTYFNATFEKIFDHEYSEISISKMSGSNDLQSTHGVETLIVSNDRNFRPGSTAVFVSALMPPSAEQLIALLAQEHTRCEPFDKPRCVEMCSVQLRAHSTGSFAAPRISYRHVVTEVRSLVDVAQLSVIFKQVNSDFFSLTRRAKVCVPQ